MNKIKLQIKNKLFGNILFEYEKENNTIKDTLEKAIKDGVNLEGANLDGANLGGANLGGAYLKGAYLDGANLGGANLGGVNLEGANLGGAYLGGAYLKGAYLGGAYLGGAYLKGAIIYYTNDDILVSTIVDDFIKDTNIKQMTVYENHNQVPACLFSMCKNVIVVNEWELKKEIKKMTIEEISKALGYDVKIVKGGN